MHREKMRIHISKKRNYSSAEDIVSLVYVKHLHLKW